METKRGWDAYEVWRTRVLLPRLENQLRQTNERVPQITKRAGR
ncbi:MAG TPA: hypothetical protein VHH11_20825 [Gammaproteobacteria bacterium]|jgi:hypothetical protein|nr:hypothetical protein [Gammaproteobacteria bacterium]